MNLNEAYLGWQQVKENGQFYVKTRNDFRRAWLMLPTNKPCSYYTKEVLGEALAASSEAEGAKVRAASVMIQVLEWAHNAEPKECPKVKFTIDDLMAYVRGEVEKPKKKAKGSLGDRHLGQEPNQEPVPDGMPERHDEPEGEPKTEDPEDDDEPKMVVKKGAKKKTDFVPEKKPKKSKASKSGDKGDKSDGEKKHPGGRPMKPVCQIDPDTLEVIATFDSCNAAIQATGASNIDRAVARVRKSAGYYWSTPDGVKTFAKRLREKQKEDEQRHVEAAGRAREAKMKKLAEQKAQAEARLPQPKVEHKPEPKAVDDSRQSKVSDALAVFTDDELIEELDRRGWYGVMRKVMVVELTKD